MRACELKKEREPHSGWSGAICISLAQSSNAVYRWFWSGLPGENSGYDGSFDAWLADSRSGRHHPLEFGILLGFYSLIVSGCYFFRLRLRGGFVLAAAAYCFLLIVPIATGLIVWDYDMFLHGIALDSISLALIPIGRIKIA
jgi:hypothetical protein